MNRVRAPPAASAFSRRMSPSTATSTWRWRCRNDCSVLTGGQREGLDLADVIGGEAVALQVDVEHRLAERTEGVHPDLLDDQVAGRVNRRVAGSSPAGGAYGICVGLFGSLTRCFGSSLHDLGSAVAATEDLPWVAVGIMRKLIALPVRLNAG